jgi:arginine decarboxylase-like protein
LKNTVGQPQAARNAPTSQSWTIEDALELYNVPAWSSGYFSINAAGHVVVRPVSRSAICRPRS